jgi:hypothetical protein
MSVKANGEVNPTLSEDSNVNIFRLASSIVTALEYNNDVVSQVICDLEKLIGTTSCSEELCTFNKGKTADIVQNYLKLYNEIDNSLHQTIMNTLQVLKEVRDETDSL